jgi:pyruvate,water dikinase
MVERNNLIYIEDINNFTNYLGNKTLNLKKCVDYGFNVPKFIALPSFISKKLLNDETYRNKISQEVIKKLQANKYAIRSSALIEDGKNQSCAGQFLTKINLSGDDLSDGLCEVLKQAKVFLDNDLDKFSIIIQEYIDADISGVTFSRNPNGSREMVIEYGFCEGEKIVSGQIKPNKLMFYWNEKIVANMPRSFIQNHIIEKFKKLESINNFPQDIEWCIKDNKFYLLQTRPITSIKKNQFEQILFLDNFLPKNEKYYFDKTEISEIAPRPSVGTYDLLQLIYSKNGPVKNVYKKNGVNYENTNFLKIIGNELFVDKEKEIQGLLPSYSCINNKTFTPKIHNLSKILPTIKNFFYLNNIKSSNCDKIFESIKMKIESKNDFDFDFKKALQNFLIDYELIFETNLLSGLSVKKVNLLLKKEPINLTEILNECSYFVDLKKYQVEEPKDLRGNSLELLDESIFSAKTDTKKELSKKVIDWWKKVPEYRKKMMLNLILEAIIYNRLREFGRWLTVKNINILKNSLLGYAKKKKFGELKNIYFSNFKDIMSDKSNEADCLNNKKNYERYNHFSLPNSIDSSYVYKKTKIIGISSGLVSGVLVDKEFVEIKYNKNKQYILYTEILSPDLTKYFNKISGIVSNNGGLLSHLAIMARENNIPVIVGLSITNSDFKMGDYVQIDGSTGQIIKK